MTSFLFPIHLTMMLVQTWLSTVDVDNPTVSLGFRPERKSLSLLRTVNSKIQQEWLITIVLFVLSGSSCDCNSSCIYPSQFFLEQLSACWCFIVVGVQTLSNHFMISGKSHSCWSPSCWQNLSRQHSFFSACVAREFFLETLHCTSSGSCFASC